MPNVCCAVGYKTIKGDNKSFYSIPGKDKPKLRKRWLDAISRKDWPDSQIKKAKICSDHFISGEKT